MQPTTQDSIRALIIPLQGRNLLLPNVAIAEVIPYLRPRAVADAPDWLLGAIGWRGLNIPLISYDRLQGVHNESALGQARIAVINTVRPDDGLRFYALVTTGIPQLKRINVASIEEVSADAGAGLLSQVRIGDIEAVVPDLIALESVVAECWQQVA